MGGVVLSLDFVIFLGADNLLVEELLHPVQGFLQQFFLYQSLLPQFVGSGHLLLAGSVAGFQTLCRCGFSRRVGLCQLRLDFWRIHEGYRVSLADPLSFLDEQDFDSSRNFSGHSVLACAGLSLNRDRIRFRDNVADDTNGKHYDCQNGDTADKIVILFHGFYLFSCFFRFACAGFPCLLHPLLSAFWKVIALSHVEAGSQHTQLDA